MNLKTLIQIGCNTGDEYVCKLIVDKKIEQAIFIDANINALKKCQLYHKEYFSSKAHQPKLDYINGAISTVDKEKKPYIDFYIPTNNSNSGHASLDATVVANQSKLNDQDKELTTVQVQNINIKDIFETYKLNSIEYLITDVEGIDYFIARQLYNEGYLLPHAPADSISIDAFGRKSFSQIKHAKINIKNYQFEFTHWGGFQQYESEKTRKELGYFLYMLINHGYTIYKSSATDILITKEPVSTYIQSV